MEIYKIDKYRFRKKIAAFDYDWTLVKPKSNATIPKDKDDWMWLRPNVPEILRKFYSAGYAIMIFTNQSKAWKVEQIKDVLTALQVPMIIHIATSKELYKPSPHMFITSVTKEWDKTNSFYCGDALGRAADWADSDLKFAKNIGIRIKEPEEIFPFTTAVTKTYLTASKEQEIIIMIGLPGSGKSTIAKQLHAYKIISGDQLKTTPKMLKATEEAIKDKQSVIIDATNPSKKKRAEFINIAKAYNIPVRCVHLTTSLEEAVYRNNNRAKDDPKQAVPKIVYNIYKKHFEEPSEDEGCQVIKI